MPIIIVNNEAGSAEIGRGDSDNNIGDNIINITHFNGQGITINQDYQICDARTPRSKQGYMVTDITDQYSFRLEK